MNATEYVQLIFEENNDSSTPQILDEAAVCEAAQLLSGSFTYLLFEALWINFFDVRSITRHLEGLYDSKNHFGVIYFVFILADAAAFTIPSMFTRMSANEKIVPVLSAAIIEDWLDYDASSEASEFEQHT